MPVRCEITGKILRMNLEGSHTPQDMKDALISAIEDPSFPEGVKFLLDVRLSSDLANRSLEEVKDVAEFFARNSEKVGRRCAVVASEPLHYGLTNMGASFANLIGAEIEVFLDIRKAISWLESE